MRPAIGARTPAVRTPTGISGFDEVTSGGLPAGRITLASGGPGTGKTIFAMESLVRGAQIAREPGVFVAFEEPSQHLLADMAAFGWRLAATPRRKKRAPGVVLFDARLPEPIVHGGDFDLLGLFAAIEEAVRRVSAKRVVFDGLDVLLDALDSPHRARRELLRLRQWQSTTGLTTIVTTKADRAKGLLSPQYDALEFLADCVVHFDHRLIEGTAVRTIRVVKLRGAPHSANEFPFTIEGTGLQVASDSYRAINHKVFSEKVSTGIARLDTMLGGGYYRGSSVLVSGVPGTAKTTLAGAFVATACDRGERALFVSFDEAPAQIVRNLASVNIRLNRHLRSGQLRLSGIRTRSGNTGAHVAQVRALVRDHRPTTLVLDPLSAFAHVGDRGMAETAALHVIDLAKREGVTVLNTTLVDDANPLVEATALGVSTVADTWIHLSYVNQGGERNRALTIVKSRGMSHSNQVRELVLSSHGVSLADVYMAGGEVLMGTLRWEKEREQRHAVALHRFESARRRHEAELALAETTAKLEALNHEKRLRQSDVERLDVEKRGADRAAVRERETLRSLRGADGNPPALRRPRRRSRPARSGT